MKSIIKSLLPKSDKEKLKSRIISVLQDKKQSHYLQAGITGITPHLASIGG